MSDLPKRQKNLIADTKNTQMKAIAPDFLDGSSPEQLRMLEYLKLKRDLGLIDDSLVKKIAGHQSPESILQLRLLEKLSRFGSTDPIFLQISSVLGTSDRVRQSGMLAKRYVNSALLKKVLQNIVGDEQSLSDLGMDEVNQDLQRSEQNDADDSMLPVAEVSFTAAA
jgi:hypothetical protein